MYSTDGHSGTEQIKVSPNYIQLSVSVCIYHLFLPRLLLRAQKYLRIDIANRSIG